MMTCLIDAAIVCLGKRHSILGSWGWKYKHRMKSCAGTSHEWKMTAEPRQHAAISLTALDLSGIVNSERNPNFIVDKTAGISGRSRPITASTALPCRDQSHFDDHCAVRITVCRLGFWRPQRETKFHKRSRWQQCQLQLHTRSRLFESPLLAGYNSLN